MFAGQISDLSAHGMHSAYSRTPAGATGLEHGIRYANVGGRSNPDCYITVCVMF